MTILPKISNFFKTNLSAVILVLITLFISFQNYTPNTFLTGWDTLHPEFNFRIYWARMLGGAWQEHQGVGAVATQAHAGEIPRVLILMLFDLFLDTSQVRYAYAFLMLILGPLGVYFFLKQIIFKRYNSAAGELGSFAGALFYLLNLATLQHFYVPLEMFLTHYGFLGWIFLYSSRYLEYKDIKNLRLFALITFLTSSQAHTSTLFFAFLLSYMLFLAVLTLPKLLKKDFAFLKYPLVLFGVTLLINLYWFLPNLYFAVTRGKEIQESKIHQLFSEEAFLQNKEFGGIKDIAILKNFLFNWNEHVGNGRFGSLLNEWKSHLNTPFVDELGYFFFFIVLAGIVLSLLKRNIYLISLFFIFLASMFFIFNVNPPLGQVFVLFQERVPLFKEAFRFPFTKFSILLAFTYAVFFGAFFAISIEQLEKIIKPALFYKIFTLLLGVFISFGLIYYSFPFFKGYLISPSMRVNIPGRYFEMFKYFDSQQEYGRAAHFPVHTFWGWIYYDWDTETNLGYQGAGFLWFGIKQPLLDREFDRWNLHNEQYYKEVSYAVYSENVNLLEKVFDKYKVRWIILDTSVISPGNEKTMLFYPQIKSLFASTKNISLEKDFGGGLYVYKYNSGKNLALTEKVSEFVYAGDSTFKENLDPIYSNFGNYASNNKKYFPFLGITNSNEGTKNEYITSDEKNIYLRNNLPFASFSQNSINEMIAYRAALKSLGKGKLQIKLDSTLNFLDSQVFEFDVPIALQDKEAVVVIDEKPAPVDLSNNEQDLGLVLFNPAKPLSVRFFAPRGGKAFSLMGDLQNKAQLENCGIEREKAAYSIEKLGNEFTLVAKGINSCLTLDLGSYIKEIKSSLIEVETKTDGASVDHSSCILDAPRGLCINTPKFSDRTFAFLEPDKNTYLFRLVIHGGLKTEEVKVKYADAKIKFFDLIYSTELVLKQSTSKIYLETLSFRKDESLSRKAYLFPGNSRRCSLSGTGFGKSVSGLLENSFVRYESYEDSAVCDSFEFSSLSHKYGYILETRSRNVQGLPLRFCITNEYSKRCDLYVSLPENKDFKSDFYFIPSMGEGEGYTVNVGNLVFGNSASINDLEYLSLTPVPYTFIKSLHSSLEGSKSNQRLLVYDQSFDNGWVAFCGLRLCRANHILVNNWANGWVFEEDFRLENVYVVFVPQALEIVGLIALLILWPIALTKRP